MFKMIYDNYETDEKYVVKTFDSFIELISFLDSEKKYDFTVTYIDNKPYIKIGKMDFELSPSEFYYIETL